MPMTTASQELEQLVARIQQQLAPDSEVLHDVKLDGHLSKRKRQVDVLVRQNVGQYEIRIVIECKDRARPINVKGVEEFDGLLKDVRGHMGVLVCPSGFSRAAKVRARGLQIELYSPVDTEPHKWQARGLVPALCNFRSAAMSFEIRTEGTFPFEIPYNFFEKNVLYDEKHNECGTALRNAVDKWNNGEYPTDVGGHHELPILDKTTTKTDNGYGMIVPIELRVSIVVKKELYFGQFPIIHLSGFRDELRGGIIANAFTVGLLSPEEVEKNWMSIADESEAPIKPVITLTGLEAWIT